MRWAEWEQVYRMHAKRRGYQYRLAQARGYVTDWLGRCKNPVVMCSGGKDSVAMSLLIAEQAPDIPLTCQVDDCDVPEKRPYLERVAAAFELRISFVEPASSLWEWVASGGGALCSDIHSKGTEMTRRFFLDPLDAHEQRMGYDGRAMGLRRAEGRYRALNYAVRGAIYKLNSGIVVGCPIVLWKDRDVFAYLLDREAEINPIYKKLKFIGDPAKVRSSWLLPGSTSARKGAAAWIRYYYPEYWRKLCRIRPEVSPYA